MTVKTRGTAGIATMIGLAALAVSLLVAATAPSVASAATCEKTWLGGNGDWNQSANWSPPGIPGGADDVCILTGNPQIFWNGVFGSGSAETITVGDGPGGNGGATLSIVATTNSGNPQDATLNSLSGTSTIDTDGIVELTATGANPGQALLQNGNTGVINNSGILRSTAGGGGRLFDANVSNLAGGTINIAYDATEGFTRTWTNNGSFNVSNGATFKITGTGGGPTFNQAGGTLQTNATGTFIQDGGFFNHTGGSTAGTKPIQLCGPQLSAATGGSGAYDFVRAIPGCGGSGGSISGTIGAGKTIRMNNTAPTAMGVSLSGPVTNNGTLIVGGTGPDELLGFTTLTNNGTFRIAGTGDRLVANSVNNSATGTIDVDQEVNFGFTPTIANNGVIDIAATRTMFITGSGPGPTYNQSGGAINVAGTLSHGGGAYNISGGTTTVSSGGQIVTNNSSIAMSGGSLRGAGTVNVGSQTLNNTGGTVHPGGSPGILTVAGNYAQGGGGTLAADVAGNSPGSGYSRLVVSGGATLGGELDVTNTVAPPPGQQLQVITAGSVAGTFAGVDVHGPPAYEVQYHPANVTLIAKGSAPPPPAGTTPDAPEFGKGPAKKTTKKKAKFSFSAPGASSYECALDKAELAPCTSPVKVKKLKPGKHRFQVRALAADGAASPVATYKWKVKKKKS